MRRVNWLIGALTLAAMLAPFAPSKAQPIECCTYNVTHHFRVCLPRGCQPQVLWGWNTLAAAWQIGPPPVINLNNGVAWYPIPSSDIKCVSAVFGQDCAFSNTCASFQVDWIPGTNCVQGRHNIQGRACVRCREHGAHSQASSFILIACRFRPPFSFIWVPKFVDQIGGGCGVMMRDPVYVKLRNPSTGETRRELLFDLTASGLNWDAQDTNGDGWPDSARIRGTNRPPKGHVTLLKRTMGGQGGESRLHIRFENGIVTESEATGEFAGLRWPLPGSTMPGPDDEGIEVPVEFNLAVDSLPPGWEAEEIEMGGGGESGQPLPRTEGDVNGDGCVDDADLLAVLFAFGQTGSGMPEDVNNDGVVDDADLLIVLFNFGGGC